MTSIPLFTAYLLYIIYDANFKIGEYLIKCECDLFFMTLQDLSLLLSNAEYDYSSVRKVSCLKFESQCPKGTEPGHKVKKKLYFFVFCTL